MNFLYNAIGNNTLENLKILERLGYKQILNSNIIGTALYSRIEGTFQFSFAKRVPYLFLIDNDELFRAIVALRNDSDFLQWFTNGTDWILCEKILFDKDLYVDCNAKNKDYRKATLEELKEHFK